MKQFFVITLVLGTILGLWYGCSIGIIPGSAEMEYISERHESDDEGPIITNPGSIQFISGKMVSETELVLEFSQPVTVISVSFDPYIMIASIEDGKEEATVSIFLEELLIPGMSFTAELMVENQHGSSLGITVPMRARNNYVPQLLINELRTVYSGTQSRVEFIEFKIQTRGNLGALRVFAASNNNNSMIYQFLPAEVQAGELVVLHLRTLSDASIDEYGDNLAESGGMDASPTARDFWIPGSTKLLRSTDAVYVLDQDDNILDAVMISETRDSWWSNGTIALAAEMLFEKGAWTSLTGEIAGPDHAVDSSGIGSAATRSISRDESMENTKTAASWFVTATGGVTPGLPNSPRN